ncbi:MAG: NADH-ubiquinone oxidoreductase [Candidatus Izimaplasma sp.]|nr:NADH-ubiquinone oxidoreductase [Candidatus Izimaplasma bacterium]
MNVVFLIAIPLLAAFISILIKKYASYLLVAVGLFNIAVLIFSKNGIVFIGGFDTTISANLLGITLLLDTYTRIALWVVNVLILVIAVLNIKTYRDYGSILLLAMAGLNGLLLTNDLFNLFVFLEISGIAAYLLSTSNKKPVSTFRYLLYGAIGSSLFLFGVVILYSMYGTLNMVVMIREISASNNYTEVILPFILMFIGLGVEAKLLPFNAWVKGVLGNSNVLSGPMIAGVYMAAMSFVLGRLVTNLFVFEGTLLTVVTLILVLGIVVGDLMAFSSSKVREILLFSSIAQSSIIILLFVNGLTIWAVYLIVANALSKTVMFLVINKATAETENDEVDSLKGLFVHNNIVGLTFTLAALSVMGLPLLVGFVIKLNYLTALAGAGQITLIAVILLASLIEGIYLVRLLVKLWYKGEKDLRVEYHFSFKMVFIAIALSLLVFGNYSTPLNELDNSIDTVSEVVNNG